MIAVGDRVPEATLLEKTDEGPAKVDLGARLRTASVAAIPEANANP